MTAFKKVEFISFLDLDTFFLMVLDTEKAFNTLNKKYGNYGFMYTITKGDNSILFQTNSFTPDGMWITLYFFDLEGKLLDTFEKEVDRFNYI